MSNDTEKKDDFDALFSAKPDSAGFDIGTLSLTPEDVATAAKSDAFEEAGSVTMDPSSSYIEADSETVTKRLRIFASKTRSSRDIVSRSVYATVNADSLDLYSTDGTSYTYTRVPAKMNLFPEVIVADVEALIVAIKPLSKKVILESADNKLYSHFHGGKVFIPQYRLDKSFFVKDFGKVLETVSVPADAILNSIAALEPVATSAEIPELSHIFMESDSAYASNGTVVCQVKGLFPKINIRQSDISVLKLIARENAQATLTFDTHTDYVVVRAPNFYYAFPNIDLSLDKTYKDILTADKAGYNVNLPYLRQILSIVLTMPEMSHVVDIDFTESSLNLAAKTRKGEASEFRLSQSKDKNSKTGLTRLSAQSFVLGVRSQGSASSATVIRSENGLSLVTDTVITSMVASAGG